LSAALSVKQVSGETVALEGELTFTTVPAAHERLREILDGRSRLVLDLASVGRADSASLALLVELQREARERGVELQMTGMPDQLMRLARLSGVDSLLTAGASGRGNPG